MASESDTIAAVSTPPGSGGVGVVRVSGLAARPLIEKITRLNSPRPRYAHFTPFYNPDGIIIDRGLSIYFPNPASFTGEDVAEFHLHGNRFILEELVDVLVQFGARRAAPGEFSLRAFLNGKMDLAQAEGLADLISAGSANAARAAALSLQGSLSLRVRDIRTELVGLHASIEAGLDFSDEVSGLTQQPELLHKAETIKLKVKDLLHAAERGRMLHEGLSIAIIGKPNAGKSSLFNALADDDCAIVSPLPGTTRDTIRQNTTVAGVPVQFIDTAGIREAGDSVEQAGIARTWKAAEQADVVLLVCDAQVSDPATDQEVLQRLPPQCAVARVFNKIDLTGHRSRFDTQLKPSEIWLSAKTGEGLHFVGEYLNGVFDKSPTGTSQFSARARHVSALCRVHDALSSLTSIWSQTGYADEVVAEQARMAIKELGQITGAVTSEELLGEIFSAFCIGK